MTIFTFAMDTCLFFWLSNSYKATQSETADFASGAARRSMKDAEVQVSMSCTVPYRFDTDFAVFWAVKQTGQIRVQLAAQQ